jgi:hypothetical protein
MRLADYFCVDCFSKTADIFTDKYEAEIELACAACDKLTTHRPVCNGGIHSRWRYADFPEDPRFYRGQTKIKATATTIDPKTGEEEPVKRYSKTGDGGVIHDEKPYTDDGRDERRDRIYKETDRKRGYTPIVCDLGKPSAPTTVTGT